LVKSDLMGAITGRDNPPPIAAIFRQRWSDAPRDPSGVWAMLDGLRDPGNLGTIIRTADAVAASGIILVGESCDPWSPECVRAATGSIFAVPLARLEGDAAGFVAAWPGETVAAKMDAARDYRRTYRSPTLLVIGGESAGLSPGLMQACGTEVRIPMPGGTESLNAAIAAALLLYEIRRPALSPGEDAARIG
jgi:TrmH family RNA methyltransferase